VPLESFAIWVNSLDGTASDLNGGWPYDRVAPSAFPVIVLVNVGLTAGSVTATVPEADKGPLIAWGAGQVAALQPLAFSADTTAARRRLFRVTNVTNETGAGAASLTLSQAATATATVTLRLGGPRVSMFASAASRVINGSAAAVGDRHSTGWDMRAAAGHTEVTDVAALRCGGSGADAGGLLRTGHAELMSQSYGGGAGGTSAPVTVICNVGSGEHGIDDVTVGGSHNHDLYGVTVLRRGAAGGGAAFRVRSRGVLIGCAVGVEAGQARWQDAVILSASRGAGCLHATLAGFSRYGVAADSVLGAPIIGNVIDGQNAGTVGVFVISQNGHETIIDRNVIVACTSRAIEHQGFNAASAGDVAPSSISGNTARDCPEFLRMTSAGTAHGVLHRLRLIGNDYAGCTVGYNFTGAGATAALLRRMGVLILANNAGPPGQAPTDKVPASWAGAGLVAGLLAAPALAGAMAARVVAGLSALARTAAAAGVRKTKVIARNL